MSEAQNASGAKRDGTGRREVLRASAASLIGTGLTHLIPPGSGSTHAAEPLPKKESAGQRSIRLSAQYYQQFDADYSLDVPAEGYGGWKRESLDFSWDHTAVVVMHAWDCGKPRDDPGRFRAVESLPRTYAICERVFPPFLGEVRRQGFRLFHVVGFGDYYQQCPGYLRTVELAGPSPKPFEQLAADASLQRLRQFRSDHVWMGKRNSEDARRCTYKRDFAPEAKPQGDEGIAEDGHQLFALCKHYGINHLIYAGFAINWCVLVSPGGMLDMSQRGVMCSAFRQAVTAVENKETARRELCKEIGLWRVALAFGFVFDVDDFVSAISAHRLDAPKEARVR